MNPKSDGTVDHIGCIDGSVLRVTRKGTEVHLHLEDHIARLSRDAAQRLAVLLQPDKRATPTAPETPPGVSRSMGVAANPSVADLLAAGLVDSGTILSLRYHGVEHTATVCRDGSIEFVGQPHSSLSAAAKAACTGASVNGWTAWRLFDGSPVDDLRWLYRAEDFPGDGHRYAPSSANERRQIARRWVRHALAAGIDPANPGDDEIEALLSGHGYSESTLGSYRRHLRDWRLLYSRDAAHDER